MIIGAVTTVNYVLDPKAPPTQKEDILVQQQSALSPNAQNFIILFATFLRTLRGLLQVLMEMCFGLYYTMFMWMQSRHTVRECCYEHGTQCVHA